MLKNTIFISFVSSLVCWSAFAVDWSLCQKSINSRPDRRGIDNLYKLDDEGHIALNPEMQSGVTNLDMQSKGDRLGQITFNGIGTYTFYKDKTGNLSRIVETLKGAQNGYISGTQYFEIKNGKCVLGKASITYKGKSGIKEIETSRLDLCRDLDEYYRKNPKMKECLQEEARGKVQTVFDKYEHDLKRNTSTCYGCWAAGTENDNLADIKMGLYNNRSKVLNTLTECRMRGFAPFLNDDSLREFIGSESDSKAGSAL